MSTSPIGTVFPAVAESALVRVGIPTGDGFFMFDGSVPVASLIPSVSSGEWTPTITTDYEDYVFEYASYMRISNTVSFIIKFTLINSTNQIFSGSTTISTPNGNAIGSILASPIYGSQISDIYAVLSSTSISVNGPDTFAFVQTSSNAVSSYEITIQGQYTIA